MNLTIALLYIIMAILIIIFGPLISIWALNTLFISLAIPYTFWTWLAMIVFNISFISRFVTYKNKG